MPSESRCCPFCGSLPRYLDVVDLEDLQPNYIYFGCRACHHVAASELSLADAKSQWQEVESQLAPLCTQCDAAGQDGHCAACGNLGIVPPDKLVDYWVDRILLYAFRMASVDSPHANASMVEVNDSVRGLKQVVNDLQIQASFLPQLGAL